MSLSKINHIVVVMMENRSFDHLLGYLALGGHPSDGLKPSMSNQDANGTPRPVHHLPDTFFPSDPCHACWPTRSPTQPGSVKNLSPNRSRWATS